MTLPRRSAAGPSGTSGYSSFADVSEMDKYKLVSNIGKGSFGVISKVQRVDDGKEFALKQLDYSKMTEKDRKQILAEVAILESLKHRNVVQLIQKIKDPKNERIYIVMEYCTSGDLGSLIRKAQRTGQPIHEDKIWNIFLQITQALHHCHWPNERPAPGQKGRPSGSRDGMSDGLPRYQVLHRDLKPENVFLSDDFVKLGDFGLSKDMGTAAFTSTYVGTPLYMPPEILAENKYDTKSDIWSLGCLVFEMCALASPFSTAQTQTELITMVKSGRLPALPAHISPALKGVVRSMLNLNPAKRPSTQDLLSMDEMKLHRKLFTVQNQASLLITRKEEIRQLDERLAARSAALDERERKLSAMLDEREKLIAAREAVMEAREQACTTKEDENKETQRRLNMAAEQLRGHWDKLREEKDAAGLTSSAYGDDRAPSRRPSHIPARPPLEERNTVPLPTAARYTGNTYAQYGETPSKIPYPSTFASPSTYDNIVPSPSLRRNATKSMGSIRDAYREQAVEATPARQTIPFNGKQRTSIGSPSELQGGGWKEDVTMASPAYSAFETPAPFVPRPRRSSIVPAGLVSRQSSGSSIPTTDSAESINSQASGSDKEHQALFPPTMIPAPTSFVYREAATPAKWAIEDPDLPSPFLHRAATAPVTILPERMPLGLSNAQPTAPQPFHGNAIGVGAKPKASIPRSRSGGLHQHVLRANAQHQARTSGEGVRPRTAQGGRMPA